MATPDEYVEITAMGDTEPKFILARRGRDVDVAKARARFLAGEIEVGEFERLVGEALSPREDVDVTRMGA